MTLTEWVRQTEERGEAITQCRSRESPGDLTFWEAWKPRDMTSAKGYDHQVREYTYYAIWDGEELILMTEDLYRARRTWTRTVAFLYPEVMGNGPVEADRIWSEFSEILHLIEEAYG